MKVYSKTWVYPNNQHTCEYTYYGVITKPTTGFLNKIKRLRTIYQHFSEYKINVSNNYLIKHIVGPEYISSSFDVRRLLFRIRMFQRIKKVNKINRNTARNIVHSRTIKSRCSRKTKRVRGKLNDNRFSWLTFLIDGAQTFDEI